VPGRRSAALRIVRRGRSHPASSKTSFCNEGTDRIDHFAEYLVALFWPLLVSLCVATPSFRIRRTCSSRRQPYSPPLGRLGGAKREGHRHALGNILDDDWKGHGSVRARRRPPDATPAARGRRMLRHRRDDGAQARRESSDDDLVPRTPRSGGAATPRLRRNPRGAPVHYLRSLPPRPARPSRRVREDRVVARSAVATAWPRRVTVAPEP
jgi:hypothetical protein